MPRPTAELQREYLRTWHIQRKAARIAKALEMLGNKCVQCDATTDLQFDHIDPKTRWFSIPVGTSRSEEDFFDEVRKCQLLCIEHHRAKTRETNNWQKMGSLEGRTHGVRQTYNQGCRCSECRKANATRRYLNKYGISARM